MTVQYTYDAGRAGLQEMESRRGLKKELSRIQRRDDDATSSIINEFLSELIKIEKHEDKMITSMVKLIESTERLNRRLESLTWLMLVLTAITFVISIPNTVATIIGIPRVSDIVSVEIILALIAISAITPLLLVIYPRWLMVRWWSKLRENLSEE
ncbi:MAG: hypothetical protein QXT81_06350 [Candidatus Bathyarchaeia archaeon]